MLIEFTTSGSAFGADAEEKWERKWLRSAEIKRVLQNVINQIENGAERGICMDINGNKVGEWRM